ncbi:alanine:cation symporter family protein [Priestia megaterium]|nr:alanine:cation symporter family protein [Priestia megaterium]
MIAFLLGVGIMYTLRLRFIQITMLKQAFIQTFGGMFKKDQMNTSGISPFQALATSVAAQVGTGNLAGVATAIAMGGPGAIFWMWVSSFFGMATIFAEAVLAQKYKEERDGQIVGGPAYYIRKGVGSKFLAGFFAVSIIIALGFIGNMVQSNSIAASFDTFNIPRIVIGVVVAALISFIIFGGIQRIAKIAEFVVPFMALFYIVGSLIIVTLNFSGIVEAFQLIFNAAFNPTAATGGVIGATIKEAIRYGVSRGLFSNEAGMGSTPHAHAAAKVEHPAQQGLVAIIAVIIDTVIICTLTALVIIMTKSYKTGLNGIQLTQESFTRGLGDLGYPFIAICLFFFAFTTILGWYYFGENNVNYLFGKKAVNVYRSLVLLFIVLGSTLDVELVWELADTFNALMVFPNVLALFILSSVVVKIYKEYKTKW